MKNVTITLDDRTADWAREHAARQQKSLSRMIGDLLASELRESRDYEVARRHILGVKPARLRTGGTSLPRRADLYQRSDRTAPRKQP